MWFVSVFKTELSRVLTYRWEFWVRFFGAALTELGLAYLLWSSLMEGKNTDAFNGRSLEWMMVYYSFSFLVQRMAIGEGFGDQGFEIYDGSLTRLLLYPVSYTLLKIAGKSAEFIVAVMQLFAMIVILKLWGAEIAWRYLPAGLCIAALSSLLYFIMISSVELTAFWADNVWSLSVLFRWTTLLLGGGMVPLFMFPSGEILSFSPFALVIEFPVRTLMGEFNATDILWRLFASLGWLAIFTSVRNLILRRGLKVYTGVGI